MKTTSQNIEVELENRSAQLSSRTPKRSAVAPAQTEAAASTERKDNRLPIDSEARKANRTLPTPKVLSLVAPAVARRVSRGRGSRQVGLGDVQGAARRRDSPAVGPAWFPLESRAAGVAAPVRPVQLEQQHKTRTRSIPATAPPACAGARRPQTPEAVAA